MELGVFHSLQAPGAFGVTPARVYGEALEQIPHAEALGISHAWLTEHHFWYDGYCPNLLPVLAAIARRHRARQREPAPAHLVEQLGRRSLVRS